MMDSKIRFERLASTAYVKDTLRVKSARGALVTAACNGIDFALRFGSAIVLARLLIPEHFGLVGMVTAVTGIADQVSSLGLSTATVQARDITHRQCSNLLWINLTVGAAFAAIICAFAPLISVFYQDSRLVTITLAISTNFVWAGLTVQHEALLSRQMKQAQGAVNRLTASFLSTCFAIVLALSGKGYWALVGREVVRGFLIAVGVWILCRWVPGVPRRGVKMRRLLRIGRNMTLTQLIYAIVSQLDGLLVGKFAGAIALGLYKQAYNLMTTPIEQLNGPVAQVARPGLSMLQTDNERYARYYRHILFLVSFTAIPIGIFSAIYAKEIVLVVLGQKWSGAAVFLRIFGVWAAISPPVETTGLVLVTCGRSERLLVVSLVHGLVFAGLMVLGVHSGALGIAVARVGTTVVLTIPKVLYSLARTPVGAIDFFKEVARPFVASIAMALVLVAYRSISRVDRELINVLSGLGIAVVVYFACFALLPGGLARLRSVASVFVEALRQHAARRQVNNCCR